MSEDYELDRYVKDPRLLVELCQKVIYNIDPGSDDTKIKEKEAQLREISRTIERLEKAGVAVPRVLRAEKTRLAASLCMKTATSQAVKHLADGFEEMLKGLKSRLRRSVSPTVAEKPQSKRSRSPSTDKEILKEHIIMALRKFGGRAKLAEVFEELGKQLEDKLLPGDLKWHEANKRYAWQDKTKWLGWLMKKEGTLRRDSPAGYWELNEDRR